MLVGIDQRIEGTEDALNFLIAGRNVLLGKVIECQGLGECEDMFGAVIALQCFSNGVFTGFDAIVPICSSGSRVALPRYDSTDNAQARHPANITNHMVQVEIHLIE